MELLFIYGTLKEPQVQKKIIGKLIDGTPDSLEGYTKSTVTIDGKVYPILVPQERNIIEGFILKVNKTELGKIDIYETNAYRRVKVSLKSGIQAWVYLK